MTVWEGPFGALLLFPAIMTPTLPASAPAGASPSTRKRSRRGHDPAQPRPRLPAHGDGDLLCPGTRRLVLQPNNSQDIAFLCCYCGCCCGVLKRLQRHPNPSEIVASAFIAALKPEVCLGCLLCLERCQMQALVKEEDHVKLNKERCIGCGLCVTTCPSGALTLMRRSDLAHSRIPVNMDATWRAIVKAQTEERNAVKKSG